VDFNRAEGFLTLLKDLEEKKKDEGVAINQLMTYCPMFTQEKVIAYMSQGEHPILVKCMVVVLSSSGELNEQ
jgi:hypothetical protein